MTKSQNMQTGVDKTSDTEWINMIWLTNKQTFQGCSFTSCHAKW